jgi:hypothetical protein
MPIHSGTDINGNFMQWGNRGKKYYYTQGDPVSQGQARAYAARQASAAYAHGYKGS